MAEEIKQSDSGSSSSSAAASTHQGDDTAAVRSSQLLNLAFGCKIICFICGMHCFPSHRYSPGNANRFLLATVIDGTCENINTKVLDAAEKQGDTQMFQRLGAGSDLVAKDASHHRKKTCLLKYIMAGSFEPKKSASAHTAIIRQLMEEYQPVMVEKEVYFLKTPRNR